VDFQTFVFKEVSHNDKSNNSKRLHFRIYTYQIHDRHVAPNEPNDVAAYLQSVTKVAGKSIAKP
jgi:hypothetical protein